MKHNDMKEKLADYISDINLRKILKMPTKKTCGDLEKLTSLKVGENEDI